MLCRAPVGACLRSNLLRKSSPAKAGSIRPVIFENRKYKNPLKTLAAHRPWPRIYCKTDIIVRRPAAQAAAASREGAGFRPAPRWAGARSPASAGWGGREQRSRSPPKVCESVPRRKLCAFATQLALNRRKFLVWSWKSVTMSVAKAMHSGLRPRQRPGVSLCPLRGPGAVRIGRSPWAVS